MSFLQKIRFGLQKFMMGRRGPDELSMAMMFAGVILSLLSSIFRLNLLYYLSLALYICALFRMFSRNVQKRYSENAKFVSLWRNAKSNTTQFANRLKNMGKYKYFKCPECHALLRLPRKVGEVTVTCGKCHHAFKQKA